MLRRCMSQRIISRNVGCTHQRSSGTLWIRVHCFVGMWCHVRHKNKVNSKTLRTLLCSGNETEIFEWLTEQFEANYHGGRAPFNLLVNSAWFIFHNSAFGGLEL